MDRKEEREEYNLGKVALVVFTILLLIGSAGYIYTYWNVIASLLVLIPLALLLKVLLNLIKKGEFTIEFKIEEKKKKDE